MKRIYEVYVKNVVHEGEGPFRVHVTAANPMEAGYMGRSIAQKQNGKGRGSGRLEVININHICNLDN